MKFSWEETVIYLKQEISSTRDVALATTRNIDVLRREIECLKIDIIKNNLEENRKSEARQRGFPLLTKDKRTMQAGLAVGIGSAIFGGLLNKDAYSALNAGIAGVDGLIRGLGETRWYVSLTNKIVVAPQDRINPQVNWVTWESITAALEKLKRKALAGERLGDFDSIVNKLRQEKLIYLRQQGSK